MSVCVVCGSSDFGDPHDGLFFCLECGTQSQDVRVEVSQLEDGRGRYTRSLRTKKGKSKKTEGEDTEHSLPLEIFQKVIKRQCDAVVALGFDPSVKEAARLIWFTYLRHYGYAFREEGRSVSGRTQNKLQFCPSSSQPGPSGSGLQFDCGTAALVRVRGRARRRGQKRPADSASTESSGTVKRAKTAAEANAGYDTFPDDKFLFEDVETANKNKNTTKELKRSQRASETADKSKNTVGKLDMSPAARETMDAAESVRMMESLRSWEELEELERAMDCRQLLAFRQAYLSAHGELKPKFVAETESWGYQPRVFKLRTTVSLLYLALLYTEQPVLPADLIRWVKSEKIPLHTPLEEDDDDSSGNKDKGVLFRTMQTVTTPSVIENAFRLYVHLPLPPLPSPDPRAISHIIIDRLRFTECFKRLVDRAMATVCLPLGFTGRRFDLECAAVIIIMLRILYGLDDCVELDECLTDASGHEDLTTDNSLPVWADWVHVYCTQVSSTSSLDEDAPPNLIDPRSSKSCQHYLKFCKDVVFSKCRSAPAPGSKSFQRFEPAFSRKISDIFASVSKLKSATEDAKLTLPADPPSPASDPSSTNNTTDNKIPRLVHVSHFIKDPKAPCTTYRPLPTSHKWYEYLEKTQLSHSMRFLISSVSEIIDTTPKSLYTVLLAVDMAFVEGISVRLRNIALDFLSEK